MPSSDDISVTIIFLVCLLPVIVPVGLWLLQLYARRGFRFAIAMDSATCLIADNGSITIKRNRSIIWLAIMLLGLVTFGFALGTISDLLRGGPYWLRGLFAVGFLAIVLVGLARQVRVSPIHIDITARILTVGHGSQSRQILFTSVKFIVIIRGEGITEIDAILHDDEKILLGTVSGSGAQKRLNRITQAITATGIAVHELTI
jgi:hypothetical protein